MEENVFTRKWWHETLDLDESQPEATTSPYQNLVLSAMPKIEKASMVFNMPIPDIQYAFEVGHEVVLSDEMWKNLENSKSYNIKSLDDAIQHSLKLGIDPKPYIEYIKQGKEIPLPLVMNYGPGKNYLIGGEVILSLYRALGSIPTVLQGVLNLQMHGSISPPITESTDTVDFEGMKLKDEQIDVIKEFIKYAAKSLGLKKLPEGLTLSYNTAEAKARHTFGYFDPNTNKVWLYVKDRNVADILRTLGHELIHRKQDEEGRIDYGSGDTGSEIENEANAQAGILLRDFGKNHEEIYEGLKKNLINEIGEDLSSAYKWEYKGGNNPTYTFSTGETKYKVVFRNEEGGTFERIYSPIGKDVYTKSRDITRKTTATTGEGKAIPVNATVMAVTLDFLEKNKDWYILTIHPIDPRRHKLVGTFLNKNIPLDKYNVEDIEGIFNITRKTK
jgi:hypothetical protein